MTIHRVSSTLRRARAHAVVRRVLRRARDGAEQRGLRRGRLGERLALAGRRQAPRAVELELGLHLRAAGGPLIFPLCQAKSVSNFWP